MPRQQVGLRAQPGAQREAAPALPWLALALWLFSSASSAAGTAAWAWLCGAAERPCARLCHPMLGLCLRWAEQALRAQGRSQGGRGASAPSAPSAAASPAAASALAPAAARRSREATARRSLAQRVCRSATSIMPSDAAGAPRLASASHAEASLRQRGAQPAAQRSFAELARVLRLSHSIRPAAGAIQVFPLWFARKKAFILRGIISPACTHRVFRFLRRRRATLKQSSGLGKSAIASHFLNKNSFQAIDYSSDKAFDSFFFLRFFAGFAESWPSLKYYVLAYF